MTLLSCGQDVFRPMRSPGARLNERTPVTTALEALPPATEPVVVAVYKFRDQTGQYKPTETGSSFSTAVTQGATNILIEALDDSGYFRPIERENVSNLLNERKIIRSTRTQYGNPDGPDAFALPPLLYAGIIIEGGIVSYDANVLTGGAGARYFGAGANARYRQDRITVSLRAISTSNGGILATVTTSRTILSQALDGGLFRFVKFQRLLEAETGYTYNEPAEIAVREAIEKAVHALVLDGLSEGLWGTTDTTGAARAQTLALAEERARLGESDLRGQWGQPARPQWFAGAHAQATRYSGDVGAGRYEYGGGATGGYRLSDRYGLSAHANYGTLATERLDYVRDVLSGAVALDVRPVPDYALAPVLRVGLGLTLPLSDAGDAESRPTPNLYYAGGVEYRLSPTLEAFATVGNYYLFSDGLDGETQGKFNDWYLSGQLGLQYLFGAPTPTR